MIFQLQTIFLPALHDTTRDEIAFYDEDTLSENNKALHQQNVITFTKALDNNAKERSRRFDTIDTSDTLEKSSRKSKTSFFIFI